jgi:hypothetical protein
MSNPFNKVGTKRISNLNRCIFYQASTILVLLHYIHIGALVGVGSLCHTIHRIILAIRPTIENR